MPTFKQDLEAQEAAKPSSPDPKPAEKPAEPPRDPDDEPTLDLKIEAHGTVKNPAAEGPES